MTEIYDGPDQRNTEPDRLPDISGTTPDESVEISSFESVEDENESGFWSEVSKAVSREDIDNMKPDVRARVTASIINSPDVLSYPIDLNADPYNADNELVHSVVFKILARSNSRIGQVAKSLGQSEVSKESANNPTNQNRVSSDKAESFTGTLGGILGGLYTVRAAKKAIRGQFGSGLGTAAKGAVTTSAGAYIGSMAVENTSLVELRTAIELYITQPPKVSYSANWENKELGALGGAFARGNKVGISATGVLSGATGIAELGARGLISAAANIPGEFGITGDLGAGIEATSKKVSNPYKEQLFTNIGFRSFEFVYKFAPRGQEELENVMRIIQKFKYHMHPENDKNNLFLEYPSEFAIEYRYRGARNQYLNKISNCALTDMEVIYGNQDSFTSFRETRGAPAEINIRLQFTELETMTNDRIGFDYKDSF
jgi:hypothetical protein